MKLEIPDKIATGRRNFIKRLIQAGFSISAACSLGYFFHDPVGPGGEKDRPGVSLADFSISRTGPKMAIARGGSRKELVTKAVTALGGMESFIQKGDRVVLKVNAAFASPAILSATTHPDIVARIIEMCLRAGAGEVIVTDNPINDPAACFNLTGIEEAVLKSGGKLVLPKKEYFKSTSVNGGKLIQNWPLLFKPLEKATKLIGLAPLKSHQRSGASMTMKNWYGLLGGRRNIFHQDIHNVIKELSLMVRPTLVILDGAYVMMTNGPTGGALSDLKQTDTLIAGTDQVAVDAFGSLLLGKTPSDLPFIGMAEKAGAGTSDYSSLSPVMI
jgi:uncharacterized protein (DUF362 family)